MDRGVARASRRKRWLVAQKWLLTENVPRSSACPCLRVRAQPGRARPQRGLAFGRSPDAFAPSPTGNGRTGGGEAPEPTACCPGADVLRAEEISGLVLGFHQREVSSMASFTSLSPSHH